VPLQMILREGRSSSGRSGSCPANMRKRLQETRGACCKVQMDLPEAANRQEGGAAASGPDVVLRW